jgi:SEC-C motif domain protein
VSCVCGVGESTETCCLPIIEGKREAKTAEELMRSRYAAYALGNIDHLMNSVHPKSPGEADRNSTEAWAKNAQWERIEILDTAAGQEGDEVGEVEFIAHFKLQNIPQTHHERAVFKRHQGKWLYFDGEQKKPEPVRRTKVGRNDPCPCGSGKKFKKCYPNCPNPFPEGSTP